MLDAGKTHFFAGELRDISTGEELDKLVKDIEEIIGDRFRITIDGERLTIEAK